MLVVNGVKAPLYNDGTGPKIVSMVRKSYLNSAANGLRPRISGDLWVKYAPEKSWSMRKVQVRAGQLHISEPTPLTMPLRLLSLQAGPVPHSLAICRGQNTLLTLQMQNELIFDQWVKTIAIELIRQTPVDAIKYLDILTLMGQKLSKNCQKLPKNCQNKAKETPLSQEIVQSLMKKCQNVETYVPVKEKLFLFESLSKIGRKVRSTEDISPRKIGPSKRTKSCQDLSQVKEICKYFENCVRPHQ